MVRFVFASAFDSKITVMKNIDKKGVRMLSPFIEGKKRKQTRRGVGARCPTLSN